MLEGRASTEVLKVIGAMWVAVLVVRFAETVRRRMYARTVWTLMRAFWNMAMTVEIMFPMQSMEIAFVKKNYVRM